MTDLSDSINKIYQLLYKDPDYQDTSASTREEKIWGEATQRAKQHERNNIALSLAKSSAMTDFSNFLSKADTRTQGPPIEAYHSAFNPKHGSLDYLKPLMFDSALNRTTKEISDLLPVYIDDLKTILDGNEQHSQFNKAAISAFEKNKDLGSLGTDDAMFALEQRMFLLKAYMRIENLAKAGEEETQATLIEFIKGDFLEMNPSLEYATEASVEALLAPLMAGLSDEYTEGTAVFDIIQPMRVKEAKAVAQLFKSFPLGEDDMVKYLPPSALEKYSNLTQDVREGQMYYTNVEGERIKAGVAKAAENLMTRDVAQAMGKTIMERWGSLDAAADSKVGRHFLNMLRRSPSGWDMTLALADQGYENPEKMGPLLELIATGSDYDKQQQVEQLVERLFRRKIAYKKDAELRGEDTGNDDIDFLYYIAEHSADEGVEVLEEDLFTTNEAGERELKDPREFGLEPAELDLLTSQYIQNTDIQTKYSNLYGSPTAPPPTVPLDEDEELLNERRRGLGLGDDPPSQDDEEEKEDDDTNDNQKLKDSVNTLAVTAGMDHKMFRADFDDETAYGWLGEEDVLTELIENVNAAYAIPGVMEIFLYGNSVDDLQSNTNKPEAEDASINIGMRVDPRQEVDIAELQQTMQVIFETSPNVSTDIFKAAKFSPDVYEPFEKTLVFYGKDFPLAEEKFMSQLDPILGVKLGGSGEKKHPFNISTEDSETDFTTLVGQTEGRRIGIERTNFNLHPLTAHRIIHDHEDITKLKEQVDKFRGFVPIAQEDDETKTDSKKTVTGRVIRDPAKNLNDSIFQNARMVDKFFPRMPILLQDMEKDMVAELTTDMSEEDKKTFIAGNSAYDKEYNNRRRKIYTDILKILPTEHKTLETFLTSVPTLLSEARSDKLSPEEKRKLVKGAFGYDEHGATIPSGNRGLYKRPIKTEIDKDGKERQIDTNDLSQTFTIGAAARKALDSGDRTLAEEELRGRLDINPFVISLMKPVKLEQTGEDENTREPEHAWEYQLDLGVQQPTLAEYQDMVQDTISNMADDMTKRTYQNVRYDIVYYDEEGQRIVLGIALPSKLASLNEIEAEERIEGEYPGQDSQWTIHSPAVVMKGELLAQPARGLSAEEDAKARRFKVLQQLIDAAPADKQKIMKDLADTIPDLGGVDSLRNSEGDAFERKNFDLDDLGNVSQAEIKSNFYSNPQLREIMRQFGVLESHYPRFTEMPFLTQSEKGVEGLKQLLDITLGDDQTLKNTLRLHIYNPEFEVSGRQMGSSWREMADEEGEVIHRTGINSHWERQGLLRKRISSLPAKFRDSFHAVWENLSQAPGDFQKYGLHISRGGDTTDAVYQMITTIVSNLHSYNRGEISRKNILPPLRSPTTKERRKFERTIDEHKAYERQRPLLFDLDDPDMQAAVRFVMEERLQHAWLSEEAKDRYMSFNVKVDESGQSIEEPQLPVPHRIVYDANEGKNVEVPIMDASSLQLVRTIFNKTFELTGVSLNNRAEHDDLAYQIVGGLSPKWHLFKVFETLYNKILLEGDDGEDTAIDYKPKIRVYSDSEALAKLNQGHLDVPMDSFAPDTVTQYISQYVPLRKLAEHLKYKNVREMFLAENVLVPESEYILNDNNALVYNSKYLGGNGYIPIQNDSIRIFLQKILSNSRYNEFQDIAETGFQHRHGQHYIDEENFKVTRATGKGQSTRHKERPTFWAVGIRDGIPIVRKLYADTAVDDVLSGVGKGEEILPKREPNILEVGVYNENGKLKSNGSHNRWGHARNKGKDSDDVSVREPTNAFLDFTELNELLTRNAIPLQAPVLQDSTKADSVNTWIRETKQFLHVLQSLNINNLSNEEDKKLFTQYLMPSTGGKNGQLLKAAYRVLSHITVGKGGDKNLDNSDFLYPYSTQEDQHNSLEAFNTYQHTSKPSVGMTITQEEHEQHMLRNLQVAIASTPLGGPKGLKALFGGHIDYANKVEPLYILLQEMDKVKTRGQYEASKNPAFEYENVVNNEINILLNGMWELIGPNHPEIKYFWEGEPYNPPESAIDVMPDIYIQAKDKIASDVTIQEEDTEKEFEGFRERYKAVFAEGGTEEEVKRRLGPEGAAQWDDIHGRLESYPEIIQALDAIPTEDLLRGNVPTELKSIFKAQIAKMRIRKPDFWVPGSKAKDFFNRADKSLGSAPWELGTTNEHGVYTRPLLLRHDDRHFLGTDPLGISGRGIRLVNDGKLNEDGTLQTAYRNSFYIKFINDDKVLGHVIKDNGTVSIWRAGEVLEPGTHGWMGAAENPRTGKAYKPYATGVEFKDIGKTLLGIEFVDPNNTDASTMTHIEPDGLLEALKRNVDIRRFHKQFASMFKPDAWEMIQERGVSDEDIQSLIKQQQGIISTETLLTTEDGEEVVLEAWLNNRADQQMADNISKEAETPTEPPISSQTDIIPEEVEGGPSPLPTRRFFEGRVNESIESRRRMYHGVLNYLNPNGTTPEFAIDTGLIAIAPLLAYLLDDNGEFNSDHLLEIDAKFVELGLHSVLHPTVPETVAWTSNEAEWSGIGTFFTRLQAMAMGTDIVLKGNELDKYSTYTPELKKALYDIFNPTDEAGNPDGDPLIADFDFRAASQQNGNDPNVMNPIQHNENIRLAATPNDKEAIIEVREGELPKAFQNLNFEQMQTKLLDMENGKLISHNGSDKKVAPWKISRDTAAKLAQNGFAVHPEIDAAINKQNAQWAMKKTFDAWDERLYLTVEDKETGKHFFNPDFLGITDPESTVPKEVQDAQIALLSQLINDNGQLKHLFNTDDGFQHVLTELKAHTFQNWDKTNDSEIGPKDKVARGTDKEHPAYGQLPRVLDNESLNLSLVAMRDKQFGDKDDWDNNANLYKTAKLTDPRSPAEVAQQLGSHDRPINETAVEPEEVAGEPESVVDPEAGTPPIVPPKPPLSVVTEDEDGGERRPVPSAYDQLSQDQKDLLAQKKIAPGGYNSMTEPAKLNAIQTDAEKEQQVDSKVDLNVTPEEEEEQKRLSDLDKVMKAHFGDNWKEDMKTDSDIEDVFKTYHHPKTGQKELDADYKKLHTDAIKKKAAAERKAKLEATTTEETTTEEEAPASKEGLTQQYIDAYRDFTRDINNPNGTTLDPAKIPDDENGLTRGIEALQLQTRKKDEAKGEIRLREKANDLSDFEQIPDGISSRMLTLKAKEAILHQMKYKYNLDSKGKSYMTEESQEAIQQVYNDILMREDEAGKKLVDMDKIWDDIQGELGEGDGIRDVLDEKGEATGEKSHFLEQDINKEKAEIDRINARHEELAETINREGLASVHYPINGHNILVSVDGKDEYEMGEGAAVTKHSGGRLRNRYNGNLVDEDGNRVTKAPTILGVEFKDGIEREYFKTKWERYYQVLHQSSSIEAEHPSDFEGLKLANDLLREKDEIEAEITEKYGKKGFNSDWFKAAERPDLPPTRPDAGLDEDEIQRPLPLVRNPNTGELEDGMYSPQLHAIINTGFYRTLLEESVKYNTNPLYGDYKQLKLRGKDYGMDEDDESLQLIQPLLSLTPEGKKSPLLEDDQGAAVLFTRNGGLYHIPSLDSYEIPENGPLSHQDFNRLVLMHGVANDMAKNPAAYSGDVANMIGFQPEAVGTLEDTPLAGDQEPLTRLSPLRQQLKDSSSVKNARRQQKQDSQASPTARFLASLGRYPKVVGEQTSVGSLLVALAGDLTELTGKRLIPVSQSQKHREALMNDYKRQADNLRQASQLAEEAGMLEQELPIDPKTKRPAEEGSKLDPYAEYRPPNIPQTENPFRTAAGAVGSAVGALGDFARRKREPDPEPSAQPLPSFPVESP